MNPLPTALAVIAVAVSLAGCATPTVTVQQQCQPINKYDTRCEEMSREAAAPPSPQPITLTRAHTVVYQLTGHGSVLPIHATTDATNSSDNVGNQNGEATAPWQLKVDAPPGMTPLLVMEPDSEVHCKVSIDGQDVTGEFPDSPNASNGILEVCGATREP